MGLLFSILLLYGLFTMGLAITWWILPSEKISASQTKLPTLTVVIPVRNEEHTLPFLLKDLAQQTYPLSHFEVIVANDASTDNTQIIVEQLSRDLPYRLTVLLLEDELGLSPKKRAITQSIQQATGTLIVTTDGDCRVGPRWLESIGQFYTKTNARLISGPVTFTPEKSAFDYLQTVESSSLIGSGACTLYWNIPTLCNGANLVYEKRVFEEVGGFSDIDQIASGDDELLMHKIAAHYPQHIRFLKSSEATVRTTSQSSLTAFYFQRKRWASKWAAYQSYWPIVLAIFIFVSNLVVLVVLFAWLLKQITLSQLFILLTLKWLPEWFFLVAVLVFLKKKAALPWIILTQLIYPFYIVFFGLAAQRKGFRWKGRELT